MECEVYLVLIVSIICHRPSCLLIVPVFRLQSSMLHLHLIPCGGGADTSSTLWNVHINALMCRVKSYILFMCGTLP